MIRSVRKRTETRSEIECDLMRMWNSDGDLYRSWRSQYDLLLEQIKAAKMVPFCKIDTDILNAHSSIKFYEISDELDAQRMLQSLSNVELRGLRGALDHYSHSYEKRVITSVLGACRRQIRHKNDWVIYRDDVYRRY